VSPDLISRSDELLKPCNANCTVCLDIKKDGYLDEKRSRCFLSLESFDFHPAVSVERFEQIFVGNAPAGVCSWELKESKEKIHLKGDANPNPNPNQIYLMNTRAEAKRVLGITKEESECNKWIRDAKSVAGELKEFFKTNRMTEFFKNRTLIRKVQLTDRSIAKALESKKRGGRLPYADKTAEALRNTCKSPKTSES
jgi:hypothetical protein